VNINKDTKLYGSFSSNPGNTGCRFFNAAFEYYGINAIYKSFKATNVKSVVDAVRCLDFQGFAVSMPFKQEILNHVDLVTEQAGEIGSANTILSSGGYLRAFNTDYKAAKELLNETVGPVVILGNGGYSKAVQYAANQIGKTCIIITRKNWYRIKDLRSVVVFNCTPVENLQFHSSVSFIDCITTTKTGQRLSIIQAAEQFNIYTDKRFGLSI